MPIDLKDIDPNTLQAGEAADAMVAEWRGWTTDTRMVMFADFSDGRKHPKQYWISPGGVEHNVPPPYSTNPAHAVEAMLTTKGWSASDVGTGVVVYVRGPGDRLVEGFASYAETNGDNGEALALAICRAIAAAMAERAGG